MQFRKFFQQTLPIIVAVVLFNGANAACSYLLGERDRNLIQIAFMNGAAKMLALDIKDLQTIKSNRALSKKVVTLASNQYLKKVEQINLPENQVASNTASSKYRTGLMP